jgi:hypothetical protein
MITRAELDDYIDAFNRSDFDGFSKYYAEDVWFQGRAAQLHGRQAVVDFYRQVKAHIDEQLVVKRAYFGEDGFAIEMETTLSVFKDWPDFPSGPLKAGDVRRSLNFIFYEVRDGKFTHIRSANFAGGAK